MTNWSPCGSAMGALLRQFDRKVYAKERPRTTKTSEARPSQFDHGKRDSRDFFSISCGRTGAEKLHAGSYFGKNRRQGMAFVLPLSRTTRFLSCRKVVFAAVC